VWPASTAFPPGPTFIQKLDTYLDLVRNPRPSAEGTVSSDDTAQSELYGSPLQRGDLVEVQGPSGSGKTSLILFFIMTTILPETYETGKSHGEIGGKIKLEIGGKGQRAALLYLESGLARIDKLRKGMKVHLEQCFRNAGMGSPANRNKAIEDIIQAALGRLVLFQIPSSSDGLDLETTSSPWAGVCSGLKSLLFYAKYRAEGEIALVVIDGLGDPYWQARWYKDQQNKQARILKGTANRIIASSELTMEDVMESLTTLRKDLGCVVFVTNQSLWKPMQPQTGKTDTTSSFWAEHLPTPWPDPFQIKVDQGRDSANPVLRAKMSRYWPLNIHITLSSPASATRQFRPDITLEETWKQGGEGYKREMARREAVWKGIVRVNLGSSKRGINQPEYGEFDMRITSDGIVVE